MKIKERLFVLPISIMIVIAMFSSIACAPRAEVSLAITPESTIPIADTPIAILTATSAASPDPTPSATPFEKCVSDQQKQDFINKTGDYTYENIKSELFCVGAREDKTYAFMDLETQLKGTLKQINLVRFLNDYMQYHHEMSSDLRSEFYLKFTDILSFLYEGIGDDIFKNGKQRGDTVVFSNNINPAILDSLFAAADYFRRVNGLENITKGKLAPKYAELISNEKYQEAITTRTTDVANIRLRIELVSNILFGVDYEWSIR